MKSIKKYSSIFLFAFSIISVWFSNPLLKAQSISGIYISEGDFYKKILTYEKKRNKKCKIKLNDFYPKNYIDIKYNHKDYRYYKDSIFGYKDNYGNTFRFFNKAIYTVLNHDEEILLYKTERIRGYPKNMEIISTYYFSTQTNSKLSLLTKNNLESYFSDNKKFKEFIEIYFKSESELIEYDYHNKMYKINRLLEFSKQP